MTEAILDIKPWGNNLGVRLPASVARAARLTLTERLALFDPAVHGGEAMAAVPLCREACTGAGPAAKRPGGVRASTKPAASRTAASKA